MSWFDDIVDSLKSSRNDAASASIGGAASTPMAQDPGPAASSAPGTPGPAASSAPAATPAPTKTQSDFTLPPMTMTPPSVTNVPFMQSRFSQAPQLSMLQNSPMGGILGAQVARKQYPFLGIPAGGVGGFGSGDY